jgi:hypothetical protein
MEKPNAGKSRIITELDRLELDNAYAHLYYYKNLLKYGPNLFEVDGSIILQSKDGLSEMTHDGRELIVDTLKYFEEKDMPYFYLMCAKLKVVLDNYDEKFKILK